ncbi:MAG: hypothetical protein L0Y35_00725 [Flammeovirgaceae bacterium]|nr:hypothetical protein [Flammeovirgaceae bacterium]
MKKFPLLLLLMIALSGNAQTFPDKAIDIASWYLCASAVKIRQRPPW